MNNKGNKLFVAALSIVTSIFPFQQVLGLPVPHINQNQPYRELRSELIKIGWQPGVFQPSGIITETIQQTEGWNEVEACSGTGLGFCRFVFQDEHGNQLGITTVNNDPQLPVSQRYIIYGWGYEPVK